MTQQDTDFTARFPEITPANFYAAPTTLANFSPTANAINVGMLSDIGRALISGPAVFDDNFYGRYVESPLTRGDAFLMGRFGDISSNVYNPAANDTELFDVDNPTFTGYVAKKNLSRQIRLNVADRWLKQFCQTEEMIGDAMAAIMSSSVACYKDDLWTAAKEYVSGSTRGALTGQLEVMTNQISTQAGQEELIEDIWSFSQNKFKYKSAKYNAAGFPTLSKNVHIALLKDAQYEMRKKLADTFHPDLLTDKVGVTIDYVDSFATPAGAPNNAGDLIGIIADERAFHFVPMPEGVVTESFRNPAAHSTYYYTTYETAYGHDLTQNIAYIFAPQ